MSLTMVDRVIGSILGFERKSAQIEALARDSAQHTDRALAKGRRALVDGSLNYRARNSVDKLLIEGRRSSEDYWEWIKIADGWHVRSLYPALFRDMDLSNLSLFLCDAEEGKTLPSHSHIQVEDIFLVQGTLRWVEANILLHSSTPHCNIPKGVEHTLEAMSDCLLIVRFEPPLPKEYTEHG